MSLSNFTDLVEVIKKLRAPDGCPWDKEQTLQSLTPHIIEEAYELTEAMENEDYPLLKEELGDVLLHVVMLSNMAEEKKKFNVYDVAKFVSDKMVYRHPHVFSDAKADTVDDVWENWEKLKKKEKKDANTMDSVPHSLPALIQSAKIQKRAKRLGFDWPSIDGPIDKIQEEIEELKDAYHNEKQDFDHIEEEAGDLLFAIVNYLQKMNIRPEEALRKSNQKFMKRFTEMEKQAEKNNKEFSDLSLEEKEILWAQVKKNLPSSAL